MFTGFCSYNKEQKAFKNEQKEKWDGDRKKISDQKIAGRSGTISAYGDGTGVPLHGTGGAGDDNLLSDEEKTDLAYRKAQLKRLQVQEHVLFTSMVNIGDCIFYSRILMTAILKRHMV